MIVNPKHDLHVAFCHKGRLLYRRATAGLFVYLIPYVCNELIFDNKLFLKKSLKEVCSPHLHDSFGTLCVKFGQN